MFSKNTKNNTIIGYEYQGKKLLAFIKSISETSNDIKKLKNIFLFSIRHLLKNTNRNTIDSIENETHNKDGFITVSQNFPTEGL